jgi:hypothetical protein
MGPEIRFGKVPEASECNAGLGQMSFIGKAEAQILSQALIGCSCCSSAMQHTSSLAYQIMQNIFEHERCKMHQVELIRLQTAKGDSRTRDIV